MLRRISSPKAEKNDPKLYKNYTPNYKRTTEKQYNLLKSRLGVTLQETVNCHENDKTIKSKKDIFFWKDLTEKLNDIGPPYRTLQQWKKVWCDFKRAERKRTFRSASPKVVKRSALNYDYEISEKSVDESMSDIVSTNGNAINIKSETKDYEQNSQSMHTIYSNEYDNEYSYEGEDTLQQSYEDETAVFMPEESSSSSYTFLNRGTSEMHTDRRQPYKLQPPNLLMLDRTMYTFQNQMEHQVKLLEQLYQMSTTMASLINHQIDAIERQTQAMHSQALAIERHTSVMNSLIDMIRDKMLKGNSQKETILTDDITDEIL